ncbi:hypothetical protein DL768_011442 [Monosporascus sp. mg162]|nr:hypothetical protein DL768_011442 [Monosporascus sp. mg162]
MANGGSPLAPEAGSRVDNQRDDPSSIPNPTPTRIRGFFRRGGESAGQPARAGREEKRERRRGFAVPAADRPIRPDGSSGSHTTFAQTASLRLDAKLGSLSRGQNQSLVEEVEVLIFRIIPCAAAAAAAATACVVAVAAVL